MTEPKSPEFTHGMTKVPCEGCPTGESKNGERKCRHPWRIIIARYVAEPQNYFDTGNIPRVPDRAIAECWNVGAAVVPCDVVTDVRPSVALFTSRPEGVEGSTVFEIY